MKDIKEILKDHGVEDVDAIAKEVIENYRSIAEVNKKDERIKDLEGQNQTMTEQIKELEGSSEMIESLKKQVTDFQEAEKARKEAEKESAKRDSFLESFNAAVGDKEFSNSLMRESVFEKAYKMCGEQSGMGAKEAIESLTKDMDGVWINPQKAAHKMPSPGQIDSKQQDEAAEKKDFARMLFGSKD